MPSFWKVSALWIFLFLLPRLHPPILAQESRLGREPGGPTLSQLSRKAGYIFAGTVTAVERIAPTSADKLGVMRVSFQVDEAIRGVQAGQTLTIREWAGLWESGEGYRPGDRLVLFLYPPSKLGLTSPVGGPAGRFSVDNDGYVALHQPRSTANGPPRSDISKRLPA
ncbi:MAG TPA: hypothetical protein VMT28_11915 [Terriglobales bacterium]|jgi:hypothetical protein|nr:hypothetical protein [Terriglobales bacterium]